MARRRRVQSAGSPKRLILDAGAVLSLAHGEQRARAFVARALELGAQVEIPVAVIAETVRGSSRDAPVHRVLNAVGTVPPTTEAIGRRAGELLGRASSSATVDALVVAQAAERGGSLVLTGDRRDLEGLAQSLPDVRVRSL